VTDNLAEIEHGIEDRNSYWRKEIDGKTVAEIAEIISGFERRATRDSLTGLINREEFGKEFTGFSEGALRRDSDVYVLFFDFDDLKKVNDKEGHQAGDELLKNGSQLIKSSLRSSDLIARIGGDELAAAIETKDGDPDRKDPEVVVQRIVTNLTNAGVSISVGVCKFKRDDIFGEVIRKAERNMKYDKVDRKAGRDFNV
jgi:diguanylate cyclase (GGDEF)-like protein